MLNQKYIWFNGKIIPFAKAKIHVLNHSLHYGSAVFEGERFYRTKKGPAAFRLKEHTKRLFSSAKPMEMKIPFTEKEIIAATLNLIKMSGLEEGYIRPIIFYGEKMGLSPAGAPLYAAIAVWPWGKYLEKEAVSVKISKFMRIHPKSSAVEAKISGHYVNSILASLEAKKAGYDEALLLDAAGNVAEGPGENIFFVKGKKIITPRLGSILQGITRDSVIKIAEDLGYAVEEKTVKLKDLKSFDESFFTGTAVEINAIGNIGDIKFNNQKEGEATKKIREVYLKAARGEIKKYEKWLTYVNG